MCVFSFFFPIEEKDSLEIHSCVYLLYLLTQEGGGEGFYVIEHLISGGGKGGKEI